MTTRRTFIKQSAIAAAGLTIGLPVFGNAQSFSKTKVIIIGAGFAGLAAAYRLKQNKVDFIILESRNRIGGRVFSHRITDELIIELGGEWVGNSHVRIQELCDEFKLELQNNQFDTHLIYKGGYTPAGQLDYSDQWNRKFEELLQNYHSLSEAEQLKLDKTDWWRYLVNNGCSGRDLDIRELVDSTDFGESIRHVSAFSALAEYAESSEKNEMDLKIKGGNGMLAHKFADKIGSEKIRLQHTVTHVDQAHGVTVRCANGKVFEADKLICTAPTFAVNNIEWLPAFPAEKQQALNELQYARINKHALVFDQRFWKDESFDMVTDQLPHYFYNATKNQPSPKGVLISYSIGDKAAVIANQSNERNAQMVMQTLNRISATCSSCLVSKSIIIGEMTNCQRGLTPCMEKANGLVCGRHCKHHFFTPILQGNT